jgi:hypothetical protein
MALHQVTNQLLEYSKDKFYSYETASRLPLCILTGEQGFHLESVQLTSQDKIFFCFTQIFFTSSLFFK